MRIAALCDIHGNLPALEAVLDDVRRADVDRIVVGGDIVPGPMVRECLARVLDLDVPVHCIFGNCETALFVEITGRESPYKLPPEVRANIRWCGEQLPHADLDVMSDWLKTARFDVDGVGSVLFCHATPRDENEIFTRITCEEHLLPIFDAANAAVVVCGHTHMQFDRMIGRTRVVNAGSVGMPFQQPAGAYWLRLGPDVELRRTSYDFEAAATRIRATAYPQAEEFAAKYVLNPPRAEDMLAMLEGVSVGRAGTAGPPPARA